MMELLQDPGRCITFARGRDDDGFGQPPAGGHPAQPPAPPRGRAGVADRAGRGLAPPDRPAGRGGRLTPPPPERDGQAHTKAPPGPSTRGQGRGGGGGVVNRLFGNRGGVQNFWGGGPPAGSKGRGKNRPLPAGIVTATTHTTP